MARVTSKGKELVLTVYSTSDADSACATLLNNDIEYVRRRIGAGDFNNVLMSMRNFGEEIFVDPEDVDKAKKVIEEWKKTRVLKQKEAQQKKEAEKTPEQIAADKKQIFTARVLGIAALAIILIIYFSKYYMG